MCLDNLFPRNETQKDPCEIYFDLPPENASQRTLLLERWKLEICKKRFERIISFLLLFFLFNINHASKTFCIAQSHFNRRHLLSVWKDPMVFYNKLSSPTCPRFVLL